MPLPAELHKRLRAISRGRSDGTAAAARLAAQPALRGGGELPGRRALGLLDRPRHPRAGQGGVAAGVILTLIGFLAVLDQYFNVDLEWIFNLWPVALMVIGLWLVVGSLRERRQG
jgi:hypothetical protein